MAKKCSAASVGLVQWIAGVILYRTVLEELGGANNAGNGSLSPPRTKKARPSSVAPDKFKAQNFTPVRGPGQGQPSSFINTPMKSTNSQLRAVSANRTGRPVKRPQTAVKGAQSQIYKGLFQESPQTGKKKKKQEPQNLVNLVAKKDRLNSELVISYL